MAREKFIYNTQTLRYEKLKEPLKYKVLKAIGFLCAVMVTASILSFTLGAEMLATTEEERMERELNQLRDKYSLVVQDLEKMEKVVNHLQDKDASVHRMVFGMDPIDEAVWNGGVGGHDPYQDISEFNESSDLIRNTQTRLEQLKRKLVLQSASLDTLLARAKNKEDMLASIPSIKPVRSDKLARRMTLLSGFGMRIHPIHKVPKFHKGMDFTSPTGTPIYATGNGTVVEVDYKRTGYGYHVTIDHGYGYETLYAHMSKILVKKGDKVKKGQEIGQVGSTGSSTAPHLHYEVHKDGKAVDPIFFCQDDLTPKEYQQLVEMAGMPNQSFD